MEFMVSRSFEEEQGLQSSSHETALVFGFLSHIYGLDEGDIQHPPLQKLDCFGVIGVHLMTGSRTGTLGTVDCCPQLFAPKGMIRQLQ